MVINDGRKKTIIEKLYNIFVNKEVDLNNNDVIAAIIAAATNMSLYIGQSYEDTLQILLEAFDASNNDEVINMLDDSIDKETIYNNIGLLLDYEDDKAVSDFYEANKEAIDGLFNWIDITYDSGMTMKKNMV